MTTETDIRDRYRALALEWAALADDPKKANRVLKRHHAYYKKIRDLPEGQRALLSMLEDPEVPVRLLAATDSLWFSPRDAEPVLAEIERSVGVYAMDAKYTLIEFRAGRLNLDW